MVVGKKSKDSCQIGKLKRIVVCGEVLYHSLSFDIGDYDGGAFWLQIYDHRKQIISDEPFAPPWSDISADRISRTIREKLPLIEWPL
jgi:hypothetical protein